MKPDQHELDGEDVHRIFDRVLGLNGLPYCALESRDSERYDEVAALIRERIGEGSNYSEARQRGYEQGYESAIESRAEDLTEQIANLTAERTRLEAENEKLKLQVATTIAQIADNEMARLERAAG